MKGRQFNKISVSASLMIVVVAVFWVWTSYQSARSNLQSMAQERAQQLQAIYDSNIDHFGRFMTQLALVIGNEDEINRLFYEGRLAVDREGGGPGGPEAALIRDEILSRLGQAWEAAGVDGTARELHFHLPPATSFLRLHQPGRYGDDLTDFRATVVAANETRARTFGLEIGVETGGIRGVVPITRSLPDGSDFHIGTLEAGMGLGGMLDLIHEESGADFSVIINSNTLDVVPTPQGFADWVMAQDEISGNRIITTTDDQAIRSLLNGLGEGSMTRGEWDPLRIFDFGAFAIARIPLRDYQGATDPARPDIGVVLAWESLDQELVAYKRAVAETIVIALFAVFFLEAMLFFALGQEQKLAVQREASVTDALTGVSNRRHFDEVLDAEIRRAARSGHPVAVILADVDFFKRFNDHYGHQVGDECLRKVASAMLGELRRAGDFMARYGGEEFVVVLPDSSLSAGLAVAEKLRRAIERLAIPHEKHPGGQKVTISLGVAAGRVSQNDAKALLAMADEALYRAKGSGRNNTQGLRFGDDGAAGQPLPLLYR